MHAFTTAPKRHPRPELPPSNGPKRPRTECVNADRGPDMIRYFDQISQDVSALNQKMKELLSVISPEKGLTAEDASAFDKMVRAVDELVINSSAIADIRASMPQVTTATPLYAAQTPAASSASAAASPPHLPNTNIFDSGAFAASQPPVPDTTPNTASSPPKREREINTTDTTTSPSPFKKRRAFVAPNMSSTPKRGREGFCPVNTTTIPPSPSPKKRRVFAVPTMGANCPTATSSSIGDNSSRHTKHGILEYTAVDNKKRFKRDHKEGADRPLAGRKRGSEEEFDGYREDVGLKRPRGAYFQPGDPPMEYESDSDDEENNPVTEEDPVCVSSDEGEEVL